jgi:excisionase family DNA binding protein
VGTLMQEGYTTKQVADLLDIDKSTLLRWIRQGKIKDVPYRDGRNWRVWLKEDVEKIREYHEKIHQLTLNLSDLGAEGSAESEGAGEAKPEEGGKEEDKKEKESEE